MDVSHLIGNTPMVEIKRSVIQPGVRIFAKLEGQNPGGSVKDRAAHSMIKGALERGEIPQGARLVEATSGNTGIALAMVCAAKGGRRVSFASTDDRFLNSSCRPVSKTKAIRLSQRWPKRSQSSVAS